MFVCLASSDYDRPSVVTFDGLVAPTIPTQAESKFRRFMELPVEIRLMIYEKLMVENVDLYRSQCYLCPKRWGCDSVIVNSNAKLAACTNILRTSKQIYSETLPIFYSKNTVHVRCRNCESLLNSECWTCPGPHDPPTERIECHRSLVKNIAIVHKRNGCWPCRELQDFPTRWPTIEREILARYKNAEHISLKTKSGYASHTMFNLVRRGRKATTERDPDYDSVIRQYTARFPCWYRFCPVLEDLETACDAIILSNACGNLRNTVFAVQSLQCIRRNVLYEEVYSIGLDLGLDKHTTSDKELQRIRIRHENWN